MAEFGDPIRKPRALNVARLEMLTRSEAILRAHESVVYADAMNELATEMGYNHQEYIQTANTANFWAARAQALYAFAALLLE